LREHPDQGEVQAQYMKAASLEVRMGFVRKVYGILVAQLLLTVVIAGPLSQMQQFVLRNTWLMPVSMVVTFGTICAMSCCGNITRTFPTNYIFLFVFTAFEAVMVGFISAQYTAQSVVLAAGVTTLVFLGMTVFAWKTKKDFTGLGPYLFAGLVVFAAFGLLLSILSICGVNIDGALMVYDVIGVLIFTFYIVFDTQRILGEHGGHKVQFGVDDYVFAALTLYLDIINLFLYLLQLFGDRRGT
jgi:FtsH-binding integral membrane protein